MLLWKLETRLQSFLIVVKRNVFGIAVNTVTHKIIKYRMKRKGHVWSCRNKEKMELHVLHIWMMKGIYLSIYQSRLLIQIYEWNKHRNRNPDDEWWWWFTTTLLSVPITAQAVRFAWHVLWRRKRQVWDKSKHPHVGFLLPFHQLSFSPHSFCSLVYPLFVLFLSLRSHFPWKNKLAL